MMMMMMVLLFLKSINVMMMPVGDSEPPLLSPTDANGFFPIKPTNLVVFAEYQCDGDGDDDKDGDDDAKICCFFAFQIHKSCCL